MKLSIISPVYKAEKMIDKLVYQIEESVKHITDDYEIILAEDGSSDNSWSKIEEVCKNNTKVKGIKLSRNFGQYPAVFAGLAHTSGDWIAVVDCDLQDNPQEISRLYEKAIEFNHDAVVAKRVNRSDKFLKKLSSKLFYKVLSYMTGTTQDPSVNSFGIYNRKIISELLKLNDYKKNFTVMLRWVGFDIGELEVKHSNRLEGDSSYSYSALINLAVDTILSFSHKPLILIIQLGLLISMASFIFGLGVMMWYFLGNISEPGYTSLMVSIWISLGVIITLFGVVGLYVGRIFEESKQRPVYIVDKKINF